MVCPWKRAAGGRSGNGATAADAWVTNKPRGFRESGGATEGEGVGGFGRMTRRSTRIAGIAASNEDGPGPRFGIECNGAHEAAAQAGCSQHSSPCHAPHLKPSRQPSRSTTWLVSLTWRSFLELHIILRGELNIMLRRG